MLLLAFRSLFFVAVIIGYSAGVWRLINDYFRREFKTFIDEEAKKNKYLLEDPVREGVPPAVVGEHNPDQPAKPVTSNQMLDELILNFGRFFTTRNEQELPSKKQQTHQTLPPSTQNQFSRQVDPSGGGGAESKPQGQQIEPPPPPKPTEPPDDPFGGARPKTIIESDEFPRSSTTTTMIAAADSGDAEEEWIQYWKNRRQVGVWEQENEEEQQQCQGSVIDSCELNLEQPAPGS